MDAATVAEPPAELSAAAYDALVDAVTLAKSESIRGVQALRRRLAQEGHAAIDIDVALKTWARYLLKSGQRA